VKSYTYKSTQLINCAFFKLLWFSFAVNIPVYKAVHCVMNYQTAPFAHIMVPTGEEKHGEGGGSQGTENGWLSPVF
jgi:hypothetical protein